MATLLTYNSFDLNDTNVITDSVDDASTPNRELKYYNLVRNGGVVVTNSEYYSKTITVKGKIVHTSQTLLESKIAALESAMTQQDKNLDIGMAATTRRYVSTPLSVKVERPVRVANWANFEIQFLCTSFGKDTSTTTLKNNVTISTTPNTQTVTPTGSAPDQLLRIAVTLFSGTGLTAKTITVKNNTTGQTITVTRDWTVSDVLEVHNENKTVKVNGVDVEFTGSFQSFAPDIAQDVIITNDFTTYSLRATIDHTQRWL